jgi:hypothetical protein
MSELDFHSACILVLGLGGFANTVANYLLSKRVRYLEHKRKVMFWERE